MAERQATVRINEAKRQAIKSRESHFSALEWFVNRDLSVFLKQCKAYALFPETDYGAVERTNWYREQLIKVWAGQDPAGIRLKILLGLQRQTSWRGNEAIVGGQRIRTADKLEEAELDPTFAVDAFSWTRIVEKLKKVLEQPPDDQHPLDGSQPEEIDFESFGLPKAKLMADWQSSGIHWEFETNFQTAIFCLMQESWRAKTCPNCRKHFVADKSAQAYCSHECYVVKKNERSLLQWRKTGKAKRVARTKRKRG